VRTEGGVEGGTDGEAQRGRQEVWWRACLIV